LATGPFAYGVAAQGNAFYGRHREIKAILANPWTFLCAQRRMGKTSLLYRLETEVVRTGGLALYFDLGHLSEEAATGTAVFDAFFRKHEEKVFRRLDVQREPYVSLPPAEAFGGLAEELIRRHPRGVTFLWDEAERLIDVAHRDPGFLQSLRGHLSNLQNFRFVIAGTQTLSDLLPEEERVSSFLRTFDWFPLAGLDHADAQRLITCQRWPGYWRSLPRSGTQNEAVAWCGGHPLMLQDFGHYLYQESSGNGKQITREMLQGYYRRSTADPSLRAIFEDDQKKHTELQHAVLRAICRAGDGISPADLAASVPHNHPAEIEMAVSLLENYGYLSRGKRISLRFRFYTNFILDFPGKALTDPRKIERLKPKLFVSYSHEDRDWLDLLLKFLNPLLRERFADCLFIDTNLKEGDKWDPEIQQALESSDLAVAIITQNFLNSQYINNHEIPKILAKVKHGRFRLLPVYAELTTVDAVPYRVDDQVVHLTDYQGLNNPGTPLSSFDKQHDQNAELVRISKAIVRNLDEVRKSLPS
jgi:hypothetical protein